MACIEKIYSGSALVGDGKCNAHCGFCAGNYLRPEARDGDGADQSRRGERAQLGEPGRAGQGQRQVGEQRAGRPGAQGGPDPLHGAARRAGFAVRSRAI